MSFWKIETSNFVFFLFYPLYWENIYMKCSIVAEMTTNVRCQKFYTNYISQQSITQLTQYFIIILEQLAVPRTCKKKNKRCTSTEPNWYIAKKKRCTSTEPNWQIAVPHEKWEVTWWINSQNELVKITDRTSTLST